MTTREQEPNLSERVGRLESQMDWVKTGFVEIKQEMRDIRQEMRDIRQEMREIHLLMASSLKWVLGLIFSSWLTMMASFWLKR